MGQSEHVEPKDTPVTSNKHHPNPSAGAVKTDGGRKKAGKEEKKNSFWKWPALHFSFSRAGTYDLAKAEEKYEIETETLCNPVTQPLGLNNPIAGFVHTLPSAG